MEKSIRLLSALQLIACAGGVLVWSQVVVKTYAQILAAKSSEASLKAAIRLDPENPVFYAALGKAQLERDALASEQSYRQAAMLNNQDVVSWMARGRLAEQRGDMAEAEASLRHAVQRSRLFEPRLQLAGFYARRGGGDPFWDAAAVAAAINKADLQPLFHLATAVESDSTQVWRRLHLKTRHARASFLGWLLAEKQSQVLGEASLGLSQVRTAADTEMLYLACERLIESGQLADAERLWLELGGSARTPTNLLINGTFRPSTGRAFDWRMATTAACDLDPAGDRSAVLHIDSADSSAELLEQFVPVEPNTTYQFSGEADISDLPAGSGLRWRIQDAKTKKVLGEAYVTARLSEFRLRTGADTSLIRVWLVYQAPGGLRGSLGLVSANLRRLTGPPSTESLVRGQV